MRVLAEDGVEVHRERPRLLTPDPARQASLIVTMGCGESCPVIVAALIDGADDAIAPLRNGLLPGWREALTELDDAEPVLGALPP